MMTSLKFAPNMWHWNQKPSSENNSAASGGDGEGRRSEGG